MCPRVRLVNSCVVLLWILMLPPHAHVLATQNTHTHTHVCYRNMRTLLKNERTEDRIGGDVHTKIHTACNVPSEMSASREQRMRPSPKQRPCTIASSCKHSERSRGSAQTLQNVSCESRPTERLTHTPAQGPYDTALHRANPGAPGQPREADVTTRRTTQKSRRLAVHVRSGCPCAP